MAVLIATILLIVLYVGIWWAISRIPSRAPRWTPPAQHLQLRHPDRLRMDLHTDKDMDA